MLIWWLNKSTLMAGKKKKIACFILWDWKLPKISRKYWSQLYSKGRVRWDGHVCIHACMCHCSCVWLYAAPWAVAPQAPLSMGFSRQEHWRILKWIAMASSRGTSWLRDWTKVSYIGRQVLYHYRHLGTLLYLKWITNKDLTENYI